MEMFPKRGPLLEKRLRQVLQEVLQKRALLSWEMTALCMALPVRTLGWDREGVEAEDSAVPDPEPVRRCKK